MNVGGEYKKLLEIRYLDKANCDRKLRKCRLFPKMSIPRIFEKKKILYRIKFRSYRNRLPEKILFRNI